MSTILTLAGAVSGLIAAGLYHRHYMYDVLNYEAFGFQQSIIPLSAKLFGHLLLW